MEFQLNQTISNQLRLYIDEIENITKADFLSVNSDIHENLPDIINKLLKDLAEEHKNDNLFFVLTTYGGSVEAVERIVNILRHFYTGEIIFAVPDYAYSAGTILCMSGDRIYMNYYSVLGPIDPQVMNKDGKFIPAQGYLDKAEEFIEKSRKNELSEAEYLMLRELDLADLRRYQQARELSIDLLKKWLVNYKFKTWNKHSSTGADVTLSDKEKRAEEIAQQLSDNSKWHSHGRGINMDTLQRELKLVIEDLDAKPNLQNALFKYHELSTDYMLHQGYKSYFCTRRFI